jgi:general secretion pathway protein A
MYESHFNLSQTPFSIAPDPAFLYLSDGHREALAHLTYGFSHGGFVLITGEVGTGKTTLLRNLVKQTPEDLDVAFVLNPRLTVRELLETLCDELGVDYPQNAGLSVKQYIDALNRHLLATHAAGRDTVVIIDEAQNLSPAVLEQIRLLTNLETDKRKLLRIILLGQPELADLLARNELRQLAQRITARYHLRGLSREDTYAYVVHRLARAGGNPQLFTRGALRRLYRISGGIPRIINLVADRALLGAYAQGRQRVSAGLVNRAAAEVLGRERHLGRWLAAGLAAATATGVAFGYLLMPEPQRAPDAAIVAPPMTEPATRREAPPALTTEQKVRSGANAANNASAESKAEASAEADPDALPTQQQSPAQRQAPTRQASLAAGEAAPPPPVEVRRPDMPAFQTQRLAFQEVFSRWGAEPESWPPGTIPCNFAPSAGLQCLSRTGSWSDIHHLNLPVVLELWDQGSAPYYGAVTRIADDGITLHLGHDRLTVSPADLQDAWFGSYVVLWQMPPDYQGTLKRGDRHPSVRWLRGQLATLGKASEQDDDPGLFDAVLQDAVVEFQREEQLLADGIVGPATWIRLGERLQLPAPSLD